jgi:hypothetical protein
MDESRPGREVNKLQLCLTWAKGLPLGEAGKLQTCPTVKKEAA